jgi:hypothetical protein
VHLTLCVFYNKSFWMFSVTGINTYITSNKTFYLLFAIFVRVYKEVCKVLWYISSKYTMLLFLFVLGLLSSIIIIIIIVCCFTSRCSPYVPISPFKFELRVFLELGNLVLDTKKHIGGFKYQMLYRMPSYIYNNDKI